MKDFAILFNQEIVARFLEAKTRETRYVITIYYQSDISLELNSSLRDLLSTPPDIDKLENCMNRHCPKEVTIHVSYLPNDRMVVDLYKTPKCRIIK